ncbi:MAG: hypothetical protein NVV59_10625 [Chitinophagaceae bacterium]|nr:hypothetical protein [Chitinophagaceae bacterium]
MKGKKKDIGRNSSDNNGEKKELLSKTAGKMQEKSNTEQLPYEESHFIDTTLPVWNYSLLTDEDVRNFGAGTNYSIYKKMGSHSIQVLNTWGMYFAVWAPNATAVSVIGHFNKWEAGAHPLTARWDKSGIWEGFIPAFGMGEAYKYHITGFEGRVTEKGRPAGAFLGKTAFHCIHQLGFVL